MSELSPRYRVVRRPSRAALIEGLVVLIFFTAVAVVATWPLARHPLGGFYGFGNDNLGTMWVYGWLHAAYFGPPSTSFSPELQAPFGWQIPEQALQPADKLYALLFGGFDRGLGAYNAEIFVSFVLAGCTMYLLARYLTGSPLASAVAGFIYTFSPFHLAQAMQYGALASIQWLPLFLLALLVLLRRRRLRDAALLGGALALVTLTSYYQAWFLGWFTLVLLVAATLYVALRARRAGRLSPAAIRRLAWLGGTRAAVAGVVAVALIIPLIATSVGAASGHKAQLVHPLTEAIRYSGRPWMLFVPPHDNPIFGPHVRSWIQLHLYDNPLTDQSIYLGYVALALAGYGLLRRGGLRIVDGWETYLLVGGFLTGLLLVMGPYVPLDRSYWRMWDHPEATRHVPSLGLAMFKIAPEFRFFSRAFMLVSLCLAALAAIGFARLERRLDGTAPRIALAVLVIALVGLEYTNAPPHVWAPEGNPAWVRAVRTLPPGASVVDYPIAPLNTPRSQYYMFWERKHRHPTFNPNESARSLQLAAEISSPDDPAAGRALHEAGIDYAIIHTRLPPQTTPPYQPALPDDSMPPDAGALNPWFEPAGRTGDAVIYRVRSAPARVTGTAVMPLTGFGGLEREASGSARWLEQRKGVLGIYVTGSPHPVEIVLTLSSFARPRTVLIALNGRGLRRVLVPSGSYKTQRIRLGRLRAGTYRLAFTTTPGPQSISATLGVPDTRSVSLRLREPVVILNR
jgi:hypothetical protein